jgi:hypothetical protein
MKSVERRNLNLCPRNRFRYTLSSRLDCAIQWPLLIAMMQGGDKTESESGQGGIILKRP